MAAPKERVGRYKTYKKKTRDLINWLTTTVSAICDLGNIIKSLARGPLRTPTASSKQDAANGHEHDITTAELLKLAEAIRDSASLVEVPEGLILIVQDIIDGRVECANWYSAQALEAGSKVDRENATHAHFITVSIGRDLRSILSQTTWLSSCA